MKKLTKKSLDELAQVMPVINELGQRKYLGGKVGDTLYISGGFLMEVPGGTSFFSDNGIETFYRGLSSAQEMWLRMLHIS